ncbi:hypothetical protein [Piscinibacter terrae]|uniref:Uncharacterized protein n=1 Tax=Piscinibacter terrae TaxID=2496871 RepID=A0A3N7HIS4_9BURK|nr:hypothetical protein [Albitalea terrae]RQP21934.1 hypothetical protein DZC73_26230 [Albitalea terrae]
MKTTCLTLLAAAVLSACATQETTSGTAAPGGSASAPATSSASKNDPGAQVTQAVATPLNDLNLVRADIPAALLAAEKAPYAAPPQATCPGITADVQALDAALGPDLDTPASPNNPSLVERGTGAAGNAAVGALRSTAENVIPFRGWVRKLSGAERYSREVAAAIAAGTIRRAYLKGLGQSMGCSAPAAPRHPA